ncbi:GNAT family N-acetyltransferase [Nitrosospira briensis]|uniref:GNAT family N-acetyltransferase n=1 Tax=Nitrosospira briensis TaxID=35799 RepID=UPI0009422A5B|nr:GNAT family N-acetyltransferase [Nitrosospira briensis]
MPDLLVKLYDLPNAESSLMGSAGESVRFRHAMAYEKHQIVNWVGEHFGNGWASECDVAFSNRPVSCHIATQRGAILGFACYDSTSRGVFGPIGVVESSRGQGLGRSLLLSCLHAMAVVGYAYAVVGGAGSGEFYRRVVNAVEIPDSIPGIYIDKLAE